MKVYSFPLIFSAKFKRFYANFSTEALKITKAAKTTASGKTKHLDGVPLSHCEHSPNTTANQLDSDIKQEDVKNQKTESDSETIEKGFYQKLIASGFSPSVSKLIIETLSVIATEKAQEINSYYLNYHDYSEILKAYHSGIEKFYIESQNTQRSHYENAKNAYQALSNGTKNVSANIMEEIKALESGIQLDINLEKKKSTETFKSVTESGQKVNVYMENKLDAVQKDLKSVEKHARAVIIGFMCVLVASFTGYTIFMSQ